MDSGSLLFELNGPCLHISGETNAQIVRMSEELAGKNEELLHYQEEISSLLAQIVDLQHKIKEVCALRAQGKGGIERSRRFVARREWLLLQRILGKERV